MKYIGKKELVVSMTCVLLLIFSCHKEDAPVTPPITQPVSKAANTYSGDFVYDYYDLMCKISKSTPGFFPPQVARAYGYTGVALYESVVSGIEGAKNLNGQLTDLSSTPEPVNSEVYNWAISANASMAEMMRLMFDKNLSTGNLNSIDSMETVTLDRLSSGVVSDVITRSKEYGKSVADALYQYSETDGGHESYLDPFQLPYSMPADSFCWVPTGAAKHPVSPYWGNNRPFLRADVDNTAPVANVSYSTEPGSDFYNQAIKVYNQVKQNNPDQIAIAKFWADDPFNTCTPAGHSFNILTQLLQENKATLEKIAVGYAKLSIAENDAFIACWKSKYQYILVRPVTYIKLHIDSNFATVIGTPAFPSYISGHSCEAGAASEVYINLFTNGDGNYNFTDESQLQYGFEPRTYINFNSMAEECADSRFFAGIHYPMDNEKGLLCGRAIGININSRIQWPANAR